MTDTNTKNALVSDAIAKKFETEKSTPYTRWIAEEGLDIIDAMYVPNLHEVELKPWARRGGRGVFMNHDASRTSNDCYVCEIPPGRQLAPQRQLYEEMIYILDGRGSTTVSNEAGKKVSFEWKAGAIFAIPLNTLHQHFNGSGKEPARFISVTNGPVIINAMGDTDFIFNTAHDFKDRFAGESDYFANKGEQKGLLLDTNFVADAINLPLISAKERGAGGGHIRFSMAKGSMNSHISQFPIGTYKKAHAHGPGAHVIVMGGQGYSLMWPEGEEPQRFEWKEGTMIVPPNMWFHQHFNTGTTPARYLAFKAEGVAIRNAQGVPKAWISRRVGGHQIDYADESQSVRQTFVQALAANGLAPRMEEAYAAELVDLPQRAGRGAVTTGRAAEH
ncbi:MAG: cupin domain-containing protein [Pseudomonadota bacterium]|nr:cupin domain-containing protein [Pseudomonadota bacterium]